MHNERPDDIRHNEHMYTCKRTDIMAEEMAEINHGIIVVEMIME